LKQRQDTNITNIGALQAFQALFTGLMGQNGYVKVPFVDVNLGPVVAIVQWGFVQWVGTAPTNIKNGDWPVTFPIAFPNACLQVFPHLCTNSFVHPGALGSAALALESGNYSKTGFHMFSDWNDSGTINVAQSLNDGNGFTGFNWIAIGY